MSQDLTAQPGNPFAINRIYLGGDGHPRVEFTGREDSYYILYQGDSLDDIVLPRDLRYGTNGLFELVDGAASPQAGARFYRTREFSKTAAETLDVVARDGLTVSANRAAGGVIILNNSNQLGPVIIGQVDTPGDACRLALSDRYLAVALGWGGLLIIDVGDPARGRVRHRLAFGLRACAVAASEEVAYVAMTSGHLVAVDLITGAVRHRLKLPEPAWDVAVAGDVLYAIGESKLCVIPLKAPGFQVGRVVAAAKAGHGNRLFVGTRLIYAPCGNGFNRFDISNPLEPVALPAVNSAHQNWKFVIGNGTGLALAAMEDPGLGLAASLQLLDVGVDGQQSNLLNSFGAASWTKSATLYNGRAHLAGGPGGLQVLHYRSADAAGLLPSIQLTSSAFTEGVECGQPLLLRADVADDVQVREVEFHINGEKVFTDGNYPFEHRFRLPSHHASQFLPVQARVVDTGGSAVWSTVHNVNLRADRTPPQASVSVPKFGLLIGLPSLLRVCFSEPVLATTIIKSRFRLFHAGPDQRLETADDSEITDFQFSLGEDGRTVTLLLAVPFPPGRGRLRVEPGFADLAGNPCPVGHQTSFAVLDGSDTDEDGLPDDVELNLNLNPTNPDTDGNDIADGLEDQDADGLGAAAELLLGTNPSLVNTDGQGATDGQEDADLDGVTNADEDQQSLNSLEADSDGDGWYDEAELTAGSNPASAASRPSVSAYAFPPVTALRPSIILPAGSSFGAVVAQPAVTVLRPSILLPEGSTFGAVIAGPEIMILRPATALSDGLLPGAVIAEPEVTVPRPSTAP